MILENSWQTHGHSGQNMPLQFHSNKSRKPPKWPLLHICPLLLGLLFISITGLDTITEQWSWELQSFVPWPAGVLDLWTEVFHVLAGQVHRRVWVAATVCSMKTKAGTGGNYLRAFVFTTNFRERMRQYRQWKKGQRPDCLEVSSRSLAKSVGHAHWQLAGVKELREVLQEARYRNKCTPSNTDLELWLKPGHFCSPYPNQTLLGLAKLWSLYGLQILGSDIPCGGRFLQKTDGARQLLGASPGESKHRGKGCFQMRFFFFKWVICWLQANGRRFYWKGFFMGLWFSLG